MLVPGSSTIAPMPLSAISRRAFSIRPRRSSSEIGVAFPGKGFSAAIDAGTARWPCASTSDGSAQAPAARADALRKVRRLRDMNSPWKR